MGNLRMWTQQNKSSIHSVYLLLIRCTFCPKNCDESCLRIKPSIASNACSPTQVQTLFKALWTTCHSPRHCTASPICKYHYVITSKKHHHLHGYASEKQKNFPHFTTIPNQQLLQKQLKRQFCRERKYKIRRPSETYIRKYARISTIMRVKHRVRKRRPRFLLSQKKRTLHLSTLKYKKKSLYEKREKIIQSLLFDNITSFCQNNNETPFSPYIPQSLFYGMPKTNFFVFFSLFVCASVHNKNTIY